MTDLRLEQCVECGREFPATFLNIQGKCVCCRNPKPHDYTALALLALVVMLLLIGYGILLLGE